MKIHKQAAMSSLEAVLSSNPVDRKNVARKIVAAVASTIFSLGVMYLSTRFSESSQIKNTTTNPFYDNDDGDVQADPVSGGNVQQNSE